MKDSERKIKETMPLEALPEYLRHLADALEMKKDHLPKALSELPMPLSKMVMEGKVTDGAWKLKLKIKGAPAPAPQDDAMTEFEPTKARETASGQPEVKYKTLKKKMKASFKAIGEAIDDRRFPDTDSINSFLADSELMVGFAGAKYGDVCYPDYSEACYRLAEAFAAKNWEAFKAGYMHLDQLKQDCHNAYK